MTKNELLQIRSDLEQKIKEQQDLADQQQRQFVQQATELNQAIAEYNQQQPDLPDNIVERAKFRTTRSAILDDLYSQLQQNQKDRQDAAGHAEVVQRNLNKQLKHIDYQLAYA